MAKNETERLLRLQTDVLEAVARRDDLSTVGAILCKHVEKIAPGIICSILHVEESGRLRTLAAPSLPKNFICKIDGNFIGPAAGSCGTAAWRNRPVIVTDIEHDPLWADHKDSALSHGLRACWSHPINDQSGKVVATFALYYRSTHSPTNFERQIVDVCRYLCSLAIENERVRAHNHRLAYFDSLTGLPNRGHFKEALANRIDLGLPFGLVLIDIDHLKLINDSIGHAAGDALIEAVASRLANFGSNVLPCRLAGDEMAVLVPGCAAHSSLAEQALRLLEATRGMVTVSNQSIDVHVTMGGAVFPTDGADADTLCQNADFALYEAKQRQRGSYLGFRPGQRTIIEKRISAVRDLDAAMIEGRLVPHYQPVVRLDTGEIVGLEALARIVAADGRILSAGEFVCGLADPRVAYELTGHIARQVARDVRMWLDAGIPFQHVGVNVTTADFQRGDLAERMQHIFGSRDVSLEHVVLEVNETVLMGGADNAVSNAAKALREQGILVALDDFGTGFASLTHLLSFPVDIIKIDKSFVQHLGEDEPAGVVVSAVLDIARQLGMRVVAEGIETNEQMQILRDRGCQLGQGYHFSRPISARDTTDLLRVMAQGPRRLQSPATEKRYA